MIAERQLDTSGKEVAARADVLGPLLLACILFEFSDREVRVRFILRLIQTHKGPKMMRIQLPN